MFMIATIQTTVSGIPTQAESSWMPTTQQLLPPAQAAKVVCRSDRGRNGRPEHEAAHLAFEREECERRHEDAEEERDAAQAWDREAMEAARVGRVDRAEPACERADGRRQHDDDREREARSVQHLEVVSQLLEHRGSLRHRLRCRHSG
jgi:hypothetical protein